MSPYNDPIARHYAAYRPALHGPILRRLVYQNAHFKTGLDIGCGTGYSTIALAAYCDRVFGLDSSQPMLDKATVHPKISYVRGSGDDLRTFDNNQFDVITFAGSLTYIKTERLKTELLRALAPDGVVLAYDFRVLLESLAARMGLNCRSTPSDYNFMENLSDWPEFAGEGTNIDRISLDLSAQEAAHLLLADSARYTAYQDLFHHADPFDQLTEQLLRENRRFGLEAEIYFSRYSHA